MFKALLKHPTGLLALGAGAGLISALSFFCIEFYRDYFSVLLPIVRVVPGVVFGFGLIALYRYCVDPGIKRSTMWYVAIVCAAAFFIAVSLSLVLAGGVAALEERTSAGIQPASIAGFIATFLMMLFLRKMFGHSWGSVLLTTAVGGAVTFFAAWVGVLFAPSSLFDQPSLYLLLPTVIFFVLWQSIMTAVVGMPLQRLVSKPPARVQNPTADS